MTYFYEKLQQSLPPVKKIQLSGSTLAYREAGTGSAILLLHGMSGDSRIWGAQLLSLSERYRVIAWDAPGFGGSDARESTADSYAQTAVDLLKALEVKYATIVGHSMGGVVAVRMAEIEPNIVERMVLSCTHLGYGQKAGGELMSRYSKRIEELDNITSEKYGTLRAQKMLAATASKDAFAFAQEVSKDARKEGIINAGRMLQEADNSLVLQHIAKPILIIYTDSDPVVNPERTNKLIKAVPQAHVIELKGVGHAPYLEDPEGYNKVLEGFIKGNTG